MLSDYFIGQPDAINQLQTAIDVSKKKGSILPHILLIAPPGSGKTLLAGRIAWEADAPYAWLAFPCEMRVLLNVMLQHHGVLLLDEIHQAERKALDMLLPFLVDGSIRHRYVNKENRRLTIIAATTDPQKLPDAFVSRFRVRPTFVDYNVEEVRQIVHQQAQGYDLNLSDEQAQVLAEASLDNPRQAIHLVHTLRDLRTLNDETTAEDVLRHLSITPQGLRREHVQYLRCLEKQGGVASQKTVAQMVFMPTESLQWVERDLLRLGIIGISNLGRELRSSSWSDDVPYDEEPHTVTSDLNPYTLEQQ